MNIIEQELNILRFHHECLARAIRNPDRVLDLLFVEKNFSRREAEELLQLCDRLNKVYETEKAEGFVYFQPLLNKLRTGLSAKLTLPELAEACVRQGVYSAFMTEMKKAYMD